MSGGSLADIIARLQAFKAELPTRVQAFAQAQGQQIVQDLHSACPVGPEAPHLADSFVVTADGAHILVQCNQGQKLLWVVLGTGIYGPIGQRIVPVRAKALYWPGAAHPYRSVAGMRPRDFVNPTLEAAQARIERQLPAEITAEAVALL